VGAKLQLRVLVGKQIPWIDWFFDLSQLGWGIEPVVGEAVVVRAVMMEEVVAVLTFAAALPELVGVEVEVKNSMTPLASLHTPNVRLDPY